MKEFSLHRPLENFEYSLPLCAEADHLTKLFIYQTISLCLKLMINMEQRSQRELFCHRILSQKCHRSLINLVGKNVVGFLCSVDSMQSILNS